MTIRTIGTHDGDFHLDELVALSTLRLIHPNSRIVRTRDEGYLKNCDVRVDVGGKYCHETGDYDHHQKEGAGKRENGVPYASAGLVWKHYGRNLCDSDEAHQLVNSRLIQFVDAEDCGVGKKFPGVYTLADVVRRFRFFPEERRFETALSFVQTVLENEIRASSAQVISNVKTRKALEKSRQLSYVVLDRDTGWQQVLVEESNKLYAIHPSSDRTNYRVRAIPIEVDGFELRKALPESWRGLKDGSLQEVTEVNDAIFCHPNGFIAGAKSLDGAVRLAEIASSQ